MCQTAGSLKYPLAEPSQLAALPEGHALQPPAAAERAVANLLHAYWNLGALDVAAGEPAVPDPFNPLRNRHYPEHTQVPHAFSPNQLVSVRQRHDCHRRIQVVLNIEPTAHLDEHPFEVVAPAESLLAHFPECAWERKLHHPAILEDPVLPSARFSEDLQARV